MINVYHQKTRIFMVLLGVDVIINTYVFVQIIHFFFCSCQALQAQLGWIVQEVVRQYEGLLGEKGRKDQCQVFEENQDLIKYIYFCITRCKKNKEIQDMSHQSSPWPDSQSIP